MNNPNVIKMKIEGAVKSHARTDILARDVESVIDEPNARGGTNLGLTPTETLMASLIGCTNVISHRIADSLDVKINKMDIDIDATFNKDGVTLTQEIEVPFPEINLNKWKLFYKDKHNSNSDNIYNYSYLTFKKIKY